MNSCSLLLVNLAPKTGKRRHFRKLSFQIGLNYGLLSLASCVEMHNHKVRIIDMAYYLDDSFKI